MAGIVNIRKDVDDKFYRYKMPVLLTKIEGKGNGIKTVLPNMSDVARALSRPPTYPTKFFGCELGAQTSFDLPSDRFIVNGAHDASRLRELLGVFIDKFVLCSSCKNPETDLTITKDEMIMRDCKACGHVDSVDMRHKLVTFILKNPPPKSSKKSKSGAKSGKKDKGGDSPAGAGEEAGSDDELTRKINEDAAALNVSSTKSQLDDWSADVSAEAVSSRVKDLAGGLDARLVLGDEDDDDAGGDTKYDVLERWLSGEDEQDGGKGEGRGATDEQVLDKVKEMGLERKHKTVQALATVWFKTDAKDQVEKHSAVWEKLVTSEKHQKSLLGGLERALASQPSETRESVAPVLLALYQADLLDEEVAKHWSTHASKKYVDKEMSKSIRKGAAPFVKWLEEAEEEE